VTPKIAEGRPGVFVVDRTLLANDRVWGKWFFPQNFLNGMALERAIDSFIADGPGRRTTPQARDRRGLPGRAWLVLDTNAVDSRLMTRANTEMMVSHCRACRRYGLAAVRAFRAVYHRWPTVADMQAAFVLYLPTALYRVDRYLRRRHELRGWRQPLKSPAGRAWLAGQALAILGRRYAVHLGVSGEVWLFQPVKNIRAKPTFRTRRTRRRS